MNKKINELCILILLSSLVSSCAAVKYGVVVGAQKSAYTESGSASSIVSGEKVAFDSYENNSSGFHIGISEESKWILTKIYYFNNSYKDSVHEFEGVDYNTSLNESGFKGTLGIKLWYFQPHFSVTSYNSTYKVDEQEYEESYTTVGAGIDIEFPISEAGYLYLGVNSDTYNEQSYEGLASISQLLHHETVYAGVRFNFFSIGGSSSKK